MSMERELCTAALLGELHELDHCEELEERRPLLLLAMESVAWLLEQGGGPLGKTRLIAIRAALAQELGEVAS